MTLSNYFDLTNPYWVSSFNTKVKKKREGVDIEPPAPRKKKKNQKYDDDEGFTGTSSLAMTLLISAEIPMKQAIGMME